MCIDLYGRLAGARATSQMSGSGGFIYCRSNFGFGWGEFDVVLRLAHVVTLSCSIIC